MVSALSIFKLEIFLEIMVTRLEKKSVNVDLKGVFFNRESSFIYSLYDKYNFFVGFFFIFLDLQCI